MHTALRLLCLCLCLGRCLSQRLPENNCNNLFHYQRQGDAWIGRVTPTQNGLKSVDWKLTFVAHGVNLPGTISNLMPYPDQATAVQNMHNGGHADINVRFDGHWDELPKIVRIVLNGQELCSASEYSAPVTTITRELQMSVSTKTTYEVARPPSFVQQQPQVTTIRIPFFISKKPLLFVDMPVTPSAPIHRPAVTTARPYIAPVMSNTNRWNNNPFLPAITSRKPVVVVDTRHDPPPTECGVEGFSGLQFGGENVPRGRFPWLAALYHDSNVDPVKIELVYKCVATLISSRTVITAAHCIYGFAPAILRVYVGRHDVTMHPEKDATLMAVQTVHTHPDFVGNLVPDSDIGLLVLTETVQYTAYVRPICLWTSSTSLGIDDSEQAAVAGWGIDSSFKQTRFPMTVNVRPVSREECLREMISAKDFLTPRTLCAGNSQGHGPCLGDSGGGLMVYRNNRWLVRGIVSLAQRAGNGCDLSRYVIYCDVARHLSWIEQNVVR
ncbi:hypothetical protein KR222_011600 [Zaprionus bogoriensis]|nr:hypothetical protein KR222_011600 [Zaprionus bogoriensis]